MTIRIYPSLMEGAPIETHEWTGTIEGWFSSKGIDLTEHDEQPVVVRVNGVDIEPEEWVSTHVTGSDDVEIRILPHGGVFKTIGRVFNFLFGWLMPSRRTPSRHDPGQGRALETASAKANEAKLGQVVPELAGRFIRYPDYLTPPRRRFVSPREQWVEFLACVGPGHYQILPHDIKIGDTRIGALGEGASYQIFEPGQSVAGHSAHEHWHSVAEVGSTSSGTAGLELSVELGATSNTDPASYTFSGNTITRSSGSFPQGWGPGTVIRVTLTLTKTYAVTGGGTFPLLDPNVFTGDFSHLMPISNGTLLTFTAGPVVGTYSAQSVSLNSAGVGSLQLWTLGDPGDEHTPPTPAEPVANVPAGDHSMTSVAVNDRTLTGMSGSFVTYSGAQLPEMTSAATIRYISGDVYGDWTSTIAACPAGAVTNTIELDFFFPQGLSRIEDNGNVVSRSVKTEVQYRDAAVGGAFTSVMRTYTERTLNQVGYTWQISVPGIRPEVRVRRVGSVTTSTQINDTIQWFGLKSRLPTRTSYPDWTTIAIRMRSGGRLGSNAENRVNLVATRILPKVNADGTIGAAQPTRNVADFVRHIVDSIGRGDDAINMQELARLSANVWQPRGEYFDYVFDETNVKEAIDTALRAGMSEFSLENGKIRPVRDDVRTVWEQGYSPQNMVKPLRRSVNPHKHDDHDGVEVEYIDSNGWVESVVQCRLPGDQGIRVEKIKLDGVTDRTRAWRFGMRHRRAMKYRRKQYSFQTELAGLNSQYLSYVPLVGEDQDYGQSAIMVSISEQDSQALIYTSEPLQWIDGKDHVVAYRNAQGDVVGPFAASPGPTENSVIADIPKPWPVVSLKMEPPHVYFGTVNDWCFPALITEINPQSTDLVNISAVNYDIRVYADDNNSPQD